jgi:O-antigen/teichoic acid export membrane protein
MSEARRFSVDVGWNVASLAVVGAGGILVNMLVAGFLGAEALGVFNLVFAIYLVASQVAVGGLQHAVLSFGARRAEGEGVAPGLMASALALVAVPALLVAGVLVAAAPAISRAMASPAVATGLVLAAPGLFFFAWNKTLLMALNAARCMRSVAVFQALRYGLLLGGVAGFALAGKADWLPAGLTLAEVVLWIGLRVQVRRRVTDWSWHDVSAAWSRRLAGFGLRGFMTGVLGELNTRVDVIMLGLFVGNAEVGVYAFAALLAEGFAQLSYVVRQNMDPIFGKHIAAGTVEALPAITRRVRRIFVPAMAVGGVGLLAFYVAGCWWLRVDSLWREGGVALAILVGGVVVNAAYRPFAGHLMVGGRPGLYTVMMTGLVGLNAGLNRWLIPDYGMTGAATATAVTLVAEAVFLAVSARRLWKIWL